MTLDKAIEHTKTLLTYAASQHADLFVALRVMIHAAETLSLARERMAVDLTAKALGDDRG